MLESDKDFEPLPIATDLGDHSILLYGQEKIGKTTIARQFPDPYFIFTEAGHKSLPEPTYGKICNTWMDVKNIVTKLCKTKKYKTIIVDTADRAYQLCMDHTCKKLGVDHPSDAQWGKGWSETSKEFARVLGKLQKNKGTIIISHAKEKEVKMADGSQRHRLVPTMSNQAREVIEPSVDIWCCYLYGKSGSRILMIKGNADIAAGTRCKEHFKLVQRTIPMGDSEEEAFSNFVKAYNNVDLEETVKKKTRRVVK